MLPSAPAALAPLHPAKLAAQLRAWLGGWTTLVPGHGRRELGTGLPECIAALNEFGRETDHEFTALAGGLAALNQSLTEIRGQNAAFQLVLEDRDEARPIASAYEVYKRSVDLVHASIGIAATEQEQMQQIETALLRACSAAAAFERNQLLLRILTMSIRMEAARMEPEHQAIFLNVGDAIGDITARITTSTNAAFARIEAVVVETAAERAHLKDIEQDLHARAQQSITTIQRELTALQGRIAPCIAQGREITTLLGQTEPILFRTLRSLQHQDIVRQQLEHVAAGFRDVEEHLRPGGSIEPEYLHQAAGVQQAHLAGAREEITQASAAACAGLRELLQASGALVDGYAAMEAAGSAAFADFRIVTLFREEISQLTQIADKSKDTNENIATLVARIEDVVRVFAKEVAAHELGVKIVALNAQIAAARVPAAEAINRLAEETSRVSDSNAEVTRQLLGDLETSLGELRRIKESAGEFLTIVDREKVELEQGIVTVTTKLTHLGTRVQADVVRVRASFAAAHARAEELLQSLRLTELIATAFDPADHVCQRLLTLTASRHGHRSLSATAAARLEAHRSRYTMMKENATHATALAAEPAVGSAATAAAAPDGDDGVELF